MRGETACAAWRVLHPCDIGGVYWHALVGSEDPQRIDADEVACTEDRPLREAREALGKFGRGLCVLFRPERLGPLGGQGDCSRPNERLPEAGDHHKVGVLPNAGKAARAKRR